MGTAVYDPKPTWWIDDGAALEKMFSPNKDAWVAAGQWFVQVHQGVKDGATDTGADYMDPTSYINRDWTDANGDPVPKPGA